VAGALAVPIPGGAAGALAARGARALGAGANVATGAKVAGIVGANVAAMKAVDAVKQKSDLNTFVGPGGDKRIGALQQAIGLVGAQIDGKMGPNTAKAIMAYQKDQGLPVTGKADPATMSKAGLAENRVHTVAEDIRSMQQKLAMIESGQWSLEEDTVYRVWLRPDNTVIDDNGVLITDDELLENIQWDPEFLAEYDYGAKYFGKGVDAIKGAAGRLFGAGRNKAAQVATKPPGTTTNTVYTQRAGNPNAAKADLPGAPTVTKDLTGAAIKPGELSATGSVGALRAQNAADNAVDAGRAASKATQASVDDMVRGGANAADDAVRGAGAALSKTGDDVASIAGKELGAGAKAADDVAGVAGKELSAAEKAAASVEAQAAKRSGRLSGWIKANPKKAVALGLVSAAAIGAGTVAALGGEEETDPTNGPTNDPTNGPTTGPDDIAPKPSGGLTPKQQELIKQIKELMAKDYGGASTPEQQAWEAATSNAQAVVGKAEKANPAQIAQDKKNAAEAAAVTSAGEKKAEEKKGGGISASPAGTTTKPPGIKPGDLFKDRQGVNRDASGKEYKQNPATKQFEPVTESDNELARWLRIARG
jgi:peptidoglycan hydrolase-like protein with peptidoglycan-binding domain